MKGSKRRNGWPWLKSVAAFGDSLAKVLVIAGVAAWLWQWPERSRFAADQRTSKHLEAWGILQTGDIAGLDGRREALESLSQDGVNLNGLVAMGFWLVGADLRGASLRGVDFSVARLEAADLRGADLLAARIDLANVWGTNIAGVTGLTESTREHLLGLGAIEIPGDRKWAAYQDSLLHSEYFWK